MMEPNRSKSKSKGGNQTASPQSYTMSLSAPSIITTHTHTYENNRNQNSREECHCPSDNADRCNGNDIVRYLSTGHAAGTGLGSQQHCIPLTAQVLFEHNLEQANVGHQQGRPKAFVTPPDGCIWSLSKEGRDAFERKPSYADILPQTQTQQQNVASMYNEADCHARDYQSAVLATDICDADCLSCDTKSTRIVELTAWGCALAGIGAHLTDHRYQEHANLDKVQID